MFNQLSGTKSQDSVHETVVPKTTTYKESRAEAGNGIDAVRLLSFRLRVRVGKAKLAHKTHALGFWILLTLRF